MSNQSKFILKSIIGSMLVGRVVGFSSGAIIIHVFDAFVYFLSIILIFWIIIPEPAMPPKWLFTGFVGSFIYSLGIILLIFFTTHNNYYLVSKWSYLLLGEKVIFGFLGAIPIWFVLKKITSKAYLLPISMGFGLGLTFLPYLLFEISNFRLKTYDNILTQQVFQFFTQELIHYTGYALLGWVLGICIYQLVINPHNAKDVL